MSSYRLLAKATDRLEWLRLRQQGLGGSDAGAILGLNVHKRAEEVLKDKLQAPPAKERVHDALRFGTIFEPYILEQLRGEYKEHDVEAGDPWGTLQSIERPWQLANIDGLLSQAGQPVGVGLEIKTCSRSMHRMWSTGIPGSYFAQVQHYMSVLGWERFDLWLCVAYADRSSLLRKFDAAPDPDAFARQITMSCVIEKYEIQRQESFIERLNSAEERFWWRVLEARKRQSPELTENAARAGQLNLFG